MNTDERSATRTRRWATSALFAVTAIALTACESESTSDSGKTDHVWKDKTDAIDKARDVQRQLDESRK